jgi:hypothetical protein
MLRENKIPVSINEWMTLMQALNQGYAFSSISAFYYLARSILVKSEAFYDQYDQVFYAYFGGIETPESVRDEVLNWLNDPINQLRLTEEEMAHLERLSLDELRKKLEERLREESERHDGGGKWIGTGGYSPFGHGGSHPTGIRIGGSGGGGMAVQVAAERRFKNYRTDLTLDVRQIKVALTRLRQFSRYGPEDELDIEQTIDRTGKNGGEIELAWQKQRKNMVKLLLIMDTGGSMEPFARLCSLLFSAAHSSSHFKDSRYFYFHNCIYQDLYKDMANSEMVPTANVLKTLGSEYKLIMVGDAFMSPYELFQVGGAIYYYYNNETPGIEWLKRLADHFHDAVWLNPMPQNTWSHATISAIGRVFPMFPMTLDGLDRAVKALIARR